MSTQYVGELRTHRLVSARLEPPRPEVHFIRGDGRIVPVSYAAVLHPRAIGPIMGRREQQGRGGRWHLGSECEGVGLVDLDSPVGRADGELVDVALVIAVERAAPHPGRIRFEIVDTGRPAVALPNDRDRNGRRSPHAKSCLTVVDVSAEHLPETGVCPGCEVPRIVGVKGTGHGVSLRWPMATMRFGRQPILSIVLAGGEGKRLMPLTADRSKPAVPFGGKYRLIDFAISNLVNGGFRHIVVLTQYKSHSLDVHISQTWQLSTILGNYVTTVPAQMRRGPRWFTGSADALFQNMNLVHDENPEHIIVFGADHIYRLDPRQMLEAHIDSGAGVTVAGIRVDASQAGEFGVIEQASDGSKIAAFHEKNPDAPRLPHAQRGLGLDG